MKYIIFLLLLFPSLTSSQGENYWEIYEINAAANAAKYHDILQSIEAGEIDKAKEILLYYQAVEVLSLEKLKEEKQIKETSQKVIDLVREYNSEFTK